MNPNICKHYILGVSIGSMMEPTAIGIIEQETRFRDKWMPETTGLSLRHLERRPVDERYPDMIERLEELLEGLEDKEQARESSLIVDVTGTGRQAGRLIKDSGLNPTMVSITSGTGEAKTDDGMWRLSKADLVGGLQVVYQADRLKVADRLPLLNEFMKELSSFKMRVSAINENDPESWRENQFDDLVFAVGLAVWQSTKETPLNKAHNKPIEYPRNSLGWMA